MVTTSRMRFLPCRDRVGPRARSARSTLPASRRSRFRRPRRSLAASRAPTSSRPSRIRLPSCPVQQQIYPFVTSLHQGRSVSLWLLLPGLQRQQFVGQRRSIFAFGVSTDTPINGDRYSNDKTRYGSHALATSTSTTISALRGTLAIAFLCFGALPIPRSPAIGMAMGRTLECFALVLLPGLRRQLLAQRGIEYSRRLPTAPRSPALYAIRTTGSALSLCYFYLRQ